MTNIMRVYFLIIAGHVVPSVFAAPGFCDADVNQDGMVSPLDYGAWLMAYNMMDPVADINEDGVVGPTDFGAFLAVYNQGDSGPGCPLGAGQDLVVIMETHVAVDYSSDGSLGTQNSGEADKTPEASDSRVFAYVGDMDDHVWELVVPHPSGGSDQIQRVYWMENGIGGGQWVVSIDVALWPDVAVNIDACELEMPHPANAAFPSQGRMPGPGEFVSLGFNEEPVVVQGDVPVLAFNCPGIARYDWLCSIGDNIMAWPCYLGVDSCSADLDPDGVASAFRTMRIRLIEPGAVPGLPESSASFWNTFEVNVCD